MPSAFVTSRKPLAALVRSPKMMVAMIVIGSARVPNPPVESPAVSVERVEPGAVSILQQGALAALKQASAESLDHARTRAAAIARWWAQGSCTATPFAAATALTAPARCR
jgi:hypothetical protein